MSENKPTAEKRKRSTRGFSLSVRGCRGVSGSPDELGAAEGPGEVAAALLDQRLRHVTARELVDRVEQLPLKPRHARRQAAQPGSCQSVHLYAIQLPIMDII